MPNPMYQRSQELRAAIITFKEEGVDTITEAERLLQHLYENQRRPKGPQR